MKPLSEFQRNPRLPLLLLGLMGVVGHLLSVLDATPPFPNYHRDIRIALVLISVILMGVTQKLSVERLKRSSGAIIFFLMSVPFLLTNWINNSTHLKAGIPWEPYRLHVFFYMVLGILVPISPWLNLVMIVLFTLEAIAMWFVLGIGKLPNANLAQQPMLMLFGFIISCVLLYNRAKDQKLTYELSETRAKNEALKSIARVFLTLRDRANTPLQTLEISAALLERKFPETLEASSSIRRSVNRLSEINQIMAAGANQVQGEGIQDELLGDEELKQLLRIEKQNTS